MQIINPRLMGVDQAHGGISFCISSENQYSLIGYSEDYDVCQGKQKAKTPDGQPFNCRAFLNKSTETLCEAHKLQQDLFTM